MNAKLSLNPGQAKASAKAMTLPSDLAHPEDSNDTSKAKFEFKAGLCELGEGNSHISL